MKNKSIKDMLSKKMLLFIWVTNGILKTSKTAAIFGYLFSLKMADQLWNGWTNGTYLFLTTNNFYKRILYSKRRNIRNFYFYSKFCLA